MKKSMKDRYLENKKRLNNSESNEEIDIDTYNKLMIECEEIIAKSELLLKIIELFMVPLVLTTFGAIVSLYSEKRLMSIGIFLIVITMEFLIVGIVYYKFFMSKFYSEKNIEIVKEYLKRKQINNKL